MDVWRSLQGIRLPCFEPARARRRKPGWSHSGVPRCETVIQGVAIGAAVDSPTFGGACAVALQRRRHSNVARTWPKVEILTLTRWLPGRSPKCIAELPGGRRDTCLKVSICSVWVPGRSSRVTRLQEAGPLIRTGPMTQRPVPSQRYWPGPGRTTAGAAAPWPSRRRPTAAAANLAWAILNLFMRCPFHVGRKARRLRWMEISNRYSCAAVISPVPAGGGLDAGASRCRPCADPAVSAAPHPDL